MYSTDIKTHIFGKWFNVFSSKLTHFNSCLLLFTFYFHIYSWCILTSKIFVWKHEKRNLFIFCKYCFQSLSLCYILFQCCSFIITICQNQKEWIIQNTAVNLFWWFTSQPNTHPTSAGTPYQTWFPIQNAQPVWWG